MTEIGIREASFLPNEWGFILKGSWRNVNEWLRQSFKRDC